MHVYCIPTSSIGQNLQQIAEKNLDFDFFRFSEKNLDFRFRESSMTN